MRRIKAILPALLACCMPAFSQSISQSVQVTNEYETKFADFQKLGVDSETPDSLYEFDYSFDYSVFDSPYRGSYEFTPYEIRITPEPMAYDGSSFMLRAGAGYGFHPVLDMYWSPVVKDNFTLGLFNTGSGYAGRYESHPLTSYPPKVIDAFDGHDFSDSFGVGGRYMMRGADLRFKAGYDGIFSGDEVSATAMHSAYAGLRLTSSEKSRTFFSYDIAADYRYAADLIGPAVASENNFRLQGSIGPVINDKFAFLLDFFFESESLDRPSGAADVAANHAALTPHVSFSLGAFDLDAGVRVDYLHSGSGGFVFAPAVDASVDLFSGSTRAYAGLTGGRRLLTMYGLKSFNHFHRGVVNTENFTREKFGAHLGVEGRLGRRFQYDLRGGYTSVENMALDYVQLVGFGDLDLVYANLDFEWISDRLDFDGSLNWRHPVASAVTKAFAPAEFTADVRAGYCWMDRIRAGVGVFGSTSRTLLDGSAASVPGFADLDLYCEYRFSRKLGGWIKFGNLLGMRIERHPGFVISGQYFTAGILLKL